MSGPLRSVIRKQIGFFASLAISCILTGLFLFSGIIPFWETGLYDRCIDFRVIHGKEEQFPFVVNIDLNDASLERLGSQIDSRQAFADALEVLRRTNTSVVLDFQFRFEKEADAAFVEAMQNIWDPVLAVLAVDRDIYGLPFDELSDSEKQLLRNHVWRIDVKNMGSIPEARTFLLPFNALGAVAGALGHINVEPDADGIYRRVPLLYRWEDGFIPSLPLAAAVIRWGISVEESIELDAGHYLTLSFSEEEKIRIPIDESGNMLVPYTNTWLGSKRIPLHTIVEAKEVPEIISEHLNDLTMHVAIIAEVSTAQKDFGPTSFERLFPLSGIHTSVLSSIMNGFDKRAFISMPSMTFKIAVILLLLIAGFFCIKTRRDLPFHLGFLLIIMAFSGITMYRWLDAAIAPWYALPATFLFFLWFSAFMFRLVGRYREQELLKNALSRYFPRALAERIMREGKTELIPAYKELTILFSDISGFTKWSSTKSSEEVHTFLNDYLESMAGIIFSYGGTVDKFMGDGILAFFGDPFDMHDHCERCIRASLAMQKKIVSLAEKWKDIVDIELKVRVGINIGKVIVGNLGSKTRIEYTVIGAAVNLAQRMESNAPLGGILVTAAVRESVKDLFSFGDRREVVVKGYEEGIEAYEVLRVRNEE